MAPTPCLRLLLIPVLLATATGALAEDFVMMKNGDRISGSIKKIWNGEVFIEPEYGDTYPIEMEYVAYIHTGELFEVEFVRDRKAETVYGRLGLDDEGRAVVLVEGDDRVYPLAQVDNMLEVEDFFDWEVRSDVSVNVSSGNSDTRSGRIYAMARIKLGEHRHKLEWRRDTAQSEGVETKDQTEIDYEDVWTFTDDWFLRGSVSWLRDPIRDLDSRSQYFLGPGFHFWDDSKRTLNISLGPNLLVEDIGVETRSSVSILAAFRYEQRFLDDDLVLFQQTDFQRVVSGRDNRILSTSTGLRWDLPRDVYVNLQVDFDRESNPADGRGKKDVTYLVGVGLELD